uniref:Uncharacterized protein n=1 Tax=Anguilla anguilla TaxID=7936 RepID=A0A0E9SZW9_ANGAN
MKAALKQLAVSPGWMSPATTLPLPPPSRNPSARRGSLRTSCSADAKTIIHFPVSDGNKPPNVLHFGCTELISSSFQNSPFL